MVVGQLSLWDCRRSLITPPLKFKVNYKTEQPGLSLRSNQKSVLVSGHHQKIRKILACSAGVFWMRECTFSYLGRQLGFGNCGGLGRGNISRGSRR